MYFSHTGPSAPIDLEPDIHGQTYLSLHWSEPTYANGVIQKYEVSWESEDVEYGIYGSDMVENVNEYTYYTIGGLEPDTVFTVTVRVSNFYSIRKVISLSNLQFLLLY